MADIEVGLLQECLVVQKQNIPRKQNDVRDPGHGQALEMRTFGAAGGEEGPDKEAEEEPEKGQEKVHKHDHPCLEHTKPQDTRKWQLNTKHREPAEPEQPETEPTDSTDKITAQPMKTETKDNKQSQKDVAANSECEELQTDFQGDQDQSTDE
ncbi:uncharacterized protein LOC111341986, partial [Stylophora pistillata]|uniref:uncharacterized protein LOC111341986 n=1 Tax=Stylophora pistillata TaxID=50429 RepID=UPI000C04BC96